MNFALTNQYDVPVDAAARTLADPRFYEEMGAVHPLSAPEVVGYNHTDGGAHLEVRYRFVANVNAAVRAVVDPAKLSWVEVSDHDLARHAVRFVMRPDHYTDLLTCSGQIELVPGAASRQTVRRSSGDLRVRVPLVGRQVERVIVDGIGEHLDGEAALLEAWVRDHDLGAADPSH